MTVPAALPPRKPFSHYVLQFIRFAIVGGFGSCVNFAVFYLAIKFAHVSPNTGSVLAFLVAVGNNYTINRAWTFRADAASVPFWKGLWHYCAIYLVGLAVNLLVLNAVLLEWGKNAALSGQALGIIAGTGFNFVLARSLVFGKSWAFLRLR